MSECQPFVEADSFVSKYCGSGIPCDRGYLLSEHPFSSQCDRQVRHTKSKRILILFRIMIVKRAKEIKLQGN